MRNNFKYIYNEEAERSLIIQVLANPKNITLCSERIPLEAMHNEVYRSVYSSCIQLNESGTLEKIGLDDVAAQLSQIWEKTEGCLKNLYDFVLEGATMGFEEAMRKVEIAYVKRRLVDIYKESQQSILTALDIQKAVNHTSERAIKVLTESEAFNYDPTDPIKEIIEEIISGQPAENYLPTGMTNLDEIIVGLSKQHITVVAGRPSLGKTSFVCNLINNLLSRKNNCIFFSLETSLRYILYRLLSIRTGLSYEQIINQKLSDVMKQHLANDILLIREWIISGRLKVIDATLNISEIEYHVTKHLSAGNKVDVVFLDYLQIISLNPARPAYLEFGDIMRKCKKIAKEKNIAFLVLSQLNRSIEEREGGMPRMSDLAYSGAIEMVSDLILILHKPKKTGEQEEQSDQMNVVIVKNRNGKTGISKLVFSASSGSFKDLKETSSI